MKLCLVLFIAIFTVHQDADAVNFDDYSAQLWSLAQKNGEDVASFGRKTVFQILKIVIPNDPFQTLKSIFRTDISPSLQRMFKEKSFIEIYSSYKGFSSFNEGQNAYNMSLMMFIAGAAQFDSTSTTQTIIGSMGGLFAGQSVAPFLNTTDSQLFQRRYLSDVYPVLLRNLDSILEQTRETFFATSLKMPERFYRSLVKDDAAIDRLLSARKKMAFAVVQNSQKDIAAATYEMKKATETVMQGLMKLGSALQGMKLYEVTSKCNISLDAIKTKTLLQITLKCSGLPEDFPLFKLMPAGSFPTKVYNTKLSDIAKEINVSMNSLLQYTTDMIIAKFMRSTGKVSFNSEPLYGVADKKGFYVVDLNDKTLFEIASLFSGLDEIRLRSELKTTIQVLAIMKNTTLRALPSVVNASLSVVFPQVHFYFLSLATIATILNNDLPRQAQVSACEDVLFTVDEKSNAVVARIFNITVEKLRKMPLLAIVSRITDRDQMVLAGHLGLTMMQYSTLQRLNLETTDEFHRIFGTGDLSLNRKALRELAMNPLYTFLLKPINFSGKVNRLNETLTTLLGPEFAQMIKLIALNMKVRDDVLSALTLEDVRSILNKSADDMKKATIFATLKDLRQLSRQIPSPDLEINIRELSARKGVPLSSLPDNSILDLVAMVSNSSWQIPLIFPSIRNNRPLKASLIRTSKFQMIVLRNIIRKYNSYNFTIKRLLSVVVSLNNVNHTVHALETLRRFLGSYLGVKSLSSLGIDSKAIKTTPFFTFALYSIIKSLQNLKKESFVKRYFQSINQISPRMLDLLRTPADGNVGEKLSKAAIDFVSYDHNGALNVLFQLHEMGKDFRNRFARKPFRKIIAACGMTNEQLAGSTVKALYKACMNTSLDEDIKQSLKLSTLLKPLVANLSLEEIGRILDMQISQQANSISSFINENNQRSLSALFMPLNDVLRKMKVDVQSGKNMSLFALFKNPLFSRFNSTRYLFRSVVFGNSLKVIKDRSIDDLMKAIGVQDLLKITPYDVLRQMISLLKTDPDRCRKLSRMPNLCHKHASCFISGDSFGCHCDEGFNGDGFKRCIDECAMVKCMKGSTCITLPGKGATCKCEHRWAKYRNGRCDRIKGATIKVAKLKLKQKFKKEYANVNSLAFKKKASEIEDALFNTVCKKIGCIAVVVTSIAEGSLVVDFNVVFKSSNVTVAVVQDAVDNAMKSPNMAALNPDTAAKPQATRSDACQSGMASCGSNQECTPTDDGYSCNCVSGYKMKGNECKKSGGLSFIVIIVIIVAAFIIIVLVIVLLIRRWKRKCHDPSSKYTMKYVNKRDTETAQLTGGDYAFSYGGEKDAIHETSKETA